MAILQLFWVVLSGWGIDLWAWLRDPNRSWNPSCNAGFFGVHVALALSVVFFTRLVEWKIARAGYEPWGAWLGLAVLMAWATIKEFWWDIREEPDTYAGSTNDWCQYFVGGVLGEGLLWMFGL